MTSFGENNKNQFSEALNRSKLDVQCVSAEVLKYTHWYQLLIRMQASS